MKLNKNNEEFLIDFLNKHLKYRETFNELHDHILSSLEHHPDGGPFETALQNMVIQQFGGINGLKKIERQYRKQMLSQMWVRYFKHILNLFVSPSILLIGITAVAMYAMFNGLSTTRSWYFPIFLMLLTIPSIINGIRYFKGGYFFSTTRRSVSDSGFKLLKYAPTLLVLAIGGCHFIFFNDSLAVALGKFQPGLATIIIMAYIIHTIAYYKMYKDEFKFTFSR